MMSFFILALLFAIFMSLPFLVPHLGFMALFGFVPLLIMDTVADLRRKKCVFPWYFLAFALWNAATTFWVCNATIGGGIAAIVLNSLQMSILFWIFRLSRKRFSDLLSYIFLALMWIAWERFYYFSDISWPWLTLGNAFARSVQDVQWYEYTGALGGSLWIWISNISIFYFIMFILGDYMKEMKFYVKLGIFLLCVVVVGGPICLSRTMYSEYEEVSEGKVPVLIGQPNIDPYQKFHSMSQAEQTDLLLTQFKNELGDSSAGRVLLIAPETFTNDIVVGEIRESTSFKRFQEFLSPYPNADFLFGASSYEYVTSAEAPSLTARNVRDNLWVETHNSALMTDHNGRHEIFHKSKLVVGTELTPYPKLFNKIDDMLGGVMAHCSGQEEISVLHLHDGTPVGCAVCYESVFGEYCTGYIKKGAKALAVITNDAWWGDTPGYLQHLSYSSLRAIETRRDIARCANTGVSAFINQRGDIVDKTNWWRRETLSGDINLSSRETFFVKYGDIVGKVSTVIFLALLLLLIIKAFIPSKKPSSRTYVRR